MGDFERNETGSRFRWALALALGASPFGCLGGQTGQPTSADGSGGCTGTVMDVPIDEPIGGVVPYDAALGIEGGHYVPLAWVDASGVAIAEVAEDEISLTFSYDGGAARYNPCGQGGPDVAVTLYVVTRDTGLVETGTAWVSFRARSGPATPGSVFGSFSLVTASSTISGTLTSSPTGALLAGSITTSALPLPLRNGRFPPP